jgi:uncharacterized Zn-finger protein
MTIGPPLKKECPYCGEIKKLLSLNSGNTFGGTHWSDTKSEYPMLPSVSDVQKCPGCGKYYFLQDAKTIPADPSEDPRRFINELFEKIQEEDV